MAFYKLFCDKQTDACAHGAASCEEGLKYPWQISLRDPNTLIPNGQDDAIRRSRSCGDDLQPPARVYTQQVDASARLVVEKLKASFPDGPKKGEQGGWLVPPLDVLDCVLSLNRNYDRFCLPRVEQFKKRHPEVQTLQRLMDLIRSYPDPLEFSIQELNYRHEARAVILVQVVEFLIKVQTGFAGSSEASRLREWAIAVRPADYQALGIRGFGLSGFQYLRILFGAQTVKPDVHICRFVSEAIGRPVGDVEAVALLEIASKHLDWPLADLDYAVWDTLARPRRMTN